MTYIKTLIEQLVKDTLKDLDKEESSEEPSEELPVLKKGHWEAVGPKELHAFQQEIYDMVQSSYGGIGGHPNFSSPSDINTSDANKWEVINVDDDPYPDAVTAAKSKPSGNKGVMGATDGQSASKRAYISRRIEQMSKPGNYIEVSHKIADILMGAGVPIVDNEEVVRKTLGKDITWLGDSGWYEREIGGSKHRKIMLGIPKA